MVVNFAPIPRHRQLSEKLRKVLIEKNLTPGDRFMSVRDISRQFSVSPVTAHRSIQELVAEEMLVIKPSKGCYVGKAATKSKIARPATGLVVVALASSAVRDTHPLLSFEILRGLHERLPTARIRQEYLPKSNPLEAVEAMIEQDSTHPKLAFVLSSPAPELRAFAVQKRLPAVIIGSTEVRTPLPCVEFDEAGLAYHAARTLLTKGRKQVYLLDRESWVYGNQLRLEGFSRAMIEHSTIAEPSEAERYYVKMPYVESLAMARLEGLLTRENCPLGIISNQDRHAAWAIRIAAARQLRIPDDLMIISLQGGEIAEQLTPRLTSIPENGYEVGTWVGTFIEKLLRKEDVRQARHMVRAQIIDRETT